MGDFFPKDLNLKNTSLFFMIHVSNAIILDDRDRLLFIRRASGKGEGLLSLPGGKLEPGETSEEALVREIKEEIGQEVDAFQPFGNVDYGFLKVDTFLARTSGPIHGSSDEVSEIIWTNLKDFKVSGFFTPDPEKTNKFFANIMSYINSRNLLRDITGYKEIIFTKRGNESILSALKAAKEKKKNTVLVQDQGGWLTYSQFSDKLGFRIVKLRTDDGLIHAEDLESVNPKGKVLLLNSYPGYLTPQTCIEKISKTCRDRGIFFINDVSGSIGIEESRFGDMILGSFGHAKPVPVGCGGFIGCRNRSCAIQVMNNGQKAFDPFYYDLERYLRMLKMRLEFLDRMNRKVKADLRDMDIIHRDKKGINVAVRINDDKDRLRIIDYCRENKLEFTICPRYIRVNEPAVSIEIKRLETPA